MSRLPFLLSALLAIGCADAKDTGADAPDEDGDGYAPPRDCDDTDPDVHPGAEETCDGVDTDCDGVVDDGASDATRWPPDADGDGYGDPDAEGALGCEPPDGHVDEATDCDDTHAESNPGAVEICDDLDNDCDGGVDEDDASDAVTWYRDGDGDGFGAPDSAWTSCDAPPGHVSAGGDCDDDDPTRWPGADEVCGDGVVNDCEGTEEDAYAACAVTGTVDLGASDALLIGENDEDRAGCSVAGAGDTNGDGFDDLLVGAWGHDGGGSGAGAAFLVLGPVSGEVDLLAADARLIGEAAGDAAGWSVSGAGDVDADGHDDLLVGAWGADDAWSQQGAAYLVYGPVSGEISLSDADARLTGYAADDYLGWSVGAAGDQNGDGYGDVLLGVTRSDGGPAEAGAAVVVLGPITGDESMTDADARFYGNLAEDAAGYSVAGIGDADGDGLDDFAVGAPDADLGGRESGTVYVVQGAWIGDLRLHETGVAWLAESSGDAAGRAVAAAGDVDGDGLADLIVGAEGADGMASGSGVAYVLLGPFDADGILRDAHARLLGVSAGDGAGSGVAGPGDVDGDGWPDLLVGAYLDDLPARSAGSAWLVRGPVEGDVDLSTGEAWLAGEEESDQAGHQVAAAGDVDGDGFPDLLVGADLSDRGGANAGAACLVLGGSW